MLKGHITMKNKDIGKQLATLNNLVRRKIENEMQSDLMKVSTANGYILFYLHDNQDKDVFQKDFEEAFSITRSTASKILSLMETKGLIARGTVDGDARLKKITMTEMGEQMRQKLIEGRLCMEKTLTEGFAQEELEQLSAYLERMKQNMKKSMKK